MKIIISAIGTKGDIYPLLGLAKGMARRGYKVIFLANPKFEREITDAKIEFHPTGTLPQYEEFHSDSNIWNPLKNILETGFESYFFPATNDAYTFINQNYQNNSNVLILTLGVTNGARIAADQNGLHHGIITLSPNIFWSIYSPSAPLCWLPTKKLTKTFATTFYWAFKIYLNFKFGSKYLRKTHKSLNINSKLYSHTYSYEKENLLIGLFPEWFGMRPKDWPKQLKLVGFPLSDDVNLDARLIVDNFIAQKGRPIVFTTGTGVHDVSDIFREGRNICEALNMPGIFTGGQAGKELLEGSELCLHVDYADFEYTLPKCKAVVHHGGIGTTAQAIRAGIPQLIRPLIFDQPDNANRIHKLGLGTFIFPEHFTAEAVAPVLKELIDNAPRNKNLAMYSADLRRSNAIEKACDLIEAHIKELQKQDNTYELDNSTI